MPIGSEVFRAEPTALPFLFWSCKVNSFIPQALLVVAWTSQGQCKKERASTWSSRRRMGLSLAADCTSDALDMELAVSAPSALFFLKEVFGLEESFYALH